MVDPLIEPSEILVGGERKRESKEFPLTWRRFFARLVDYALFFYFLLALEWFFELPWSFIHRWESWTFVPPEYLLYIPIETLFLFFWGKTPGKWVFRLSLRDDTKRGRTLRRSFLRSVKVWVFGLAMGIEWLNGLACFLAYSKVRVGQKTSWDVQENFSPLSKPLSEKRFWIFAVLGLFSYYWYFKRVSH